jgi:hypothetical protein
MTEPQQPDSTRKGFEQLLAAKKAKQQGAGGSGQAGRGGPSQLPDAKSGKSFKRRKV